MIRCVGRRRFHDGLIIIDWKPKNRIEFGSLHLYEIPLEGLEAE